MRDKRSYVQGEWVLVRAGSVNRRNGHSVLQERAGGRSIQEMATSFPSETLLLFSCPKTNVRAI